MYASSYDTIRYDMTILMCAQKLTDASLIYRLELCRIRADLIFLLQDYLRSSSVVSRQVFHV